MPRDPTLRLVIFDLDGVLCEFDAAARLRHLESVSGVSGDHIDAAIYRSDFERDAEAGAYPTGAEYLAAFNARIGATVTREEWIAGRRAAMRVRPEVLASLRRLVRRIPAALLTNNGALLLEALPELVPEVYQLLRPRCHASCEFAARKPEPGVYRRLLARYDLPPGAALFIDDSSANVEGARAAGLHGLLYRGPEGLERDLAPYLAPDP